MVNIVVKFLTAITGKTPQDIASMTDAITFETPLSAGGADYQLLVESNAWDPQSITPTSLVRPRPS
jgi:hypothetical protein